MFQIHSTERCNPVIQAVEQVFVCVCASDFSFPPHTCKRFTDLDVCLNPSTIPNLCIWMCVFKWTNKTRELYARIKKLQMKQNKKFRCKNWNTINLNVKKQKSRKLWTINYGVKWKKSSEIKKIQKIKNKYQNHYQLIVNRKLMCIK